MAIEFARPRFIQRSKGHNAVEVAAYNIRERLYCDLTGQLTPRLAPSTIATHVYHEIMLPSGADTCFSEAGMLWNAVQKAEHRKDSQEAFEVVLPLPADPEITPGDRIELARAFARENFSSRGLVVQIDIHTPHSANAETQVINHHAHLLVTTRRLEGEKLALRKATELFPKIRSLPFGKPIVAEKDPWGVKWRDFQDKWFADHGKAITVDPVAPVPGEHLGPKRFRHPQDRRLKTAEEVRELNTTIARNPEAVASHLSQQQHFDGRALDRFLVKHLPPEKREAVAADVRTRLHNLQREALAKASWSDKVASGLRPLSVEDIARELSPKYARLLQTAKELREDARKADWIKGRQTADKEAGEYRVKERWAEMGVARRSLHMLGASFSSLAGLRDIELDRWSSLNKQGTRAEHRWSIRGAAISGGAPGRPTGNLQAVMREAALELETIRPEAERVLADRQKNARNARAALENLEQRDKLTRRARRSVSM